MGWLVKHCAFPMPPKVTGYFVSVGSIGIYVVVVIITSVVSETVQLKARLTKVRE